ncbi:MAG: dipeptidase [Peptostreptococcaceae bacterium]
MKLIDLHCDTIDLIVDSNKNLRENDLTVDIQKLKKADSLVQTFALFVDKNSVKSPYKRCINMYKKFNFEMENDEISLLTKYCQIKENYNKNIISALLSIEEGAVFEGDIKKVQEFYDLGVRITTLTWNYENEISYPNGYDRGLKEFGFEVVDKMNELGMIIDVSHLSDKGFYDVYENSKKPFIATHSNAREITNHKRNLTDDMIKKLSEVGGVTGINFCKFFLTENENILDSKIDFMIDHIKHIKNVGGIDVLSIGSDFDGIPNKVEIEDISQMDKLYSRLKKEEFTEDEIEKIFYKNSLRVLKDVLK